MPSAETDAGLSGVAANTFVQVLVDEIEGNISTIYPKVSGAYVPKVKQGRKEVHPEDFGALGDGAPMDVDRQDPDFAYRPLRTTSQWQRSITDKEVFLDGLVPDRAIHVAIDCNNLLVQQVAVPEGDTCGDVSRDAVDARSVAYALTSGNWRGGFLLARGGDELSCSTATGDIIRAAVIWTTNAHFVCFASGMRVCRGLWYKLIGGSAMLVSNIDWSSLGDHDAWLLGRVNLEIALHSVLQFSVCLNGRSIVGPIGIAAALVTYFGFAGAISPSITSAY